MQAHGRVVLALLAIGGAAAVQSVILRHEAETCAWVEQELRASPRPGRVGWAPPPPCQSGREKACPDALCSNGRTNHSAYVFTTMDEQQALMR